MSLRFASSVVLCLLSLLSVGMTRGAEAPITLSGPNGAAIRFTEANGLWRWTGLTTPRAAEEWSIEEENSPLVVSGTDDAVVTGWTLAGQEAGKLILEQETAAARLSLRRVFSFGPSQNVVRIETWVRSAGGEKVITRAGLLDVRVVGETFRETGAVPASFPLFGQSLFVGIEHVSGVCRIDGDTARLWQTPHLKADSDWRFVAAAVVGWALPSDCSLIAGDARVRDAFLQYLDPIRIKPADLELHTNTWWTLPLPFSEQDVLRDIEALRLGFATRTGMFFDSFALDLGWSDPKSIWRVDARRFPNELRTINQRLTALGTRLGLWVSPGSAYPEGLDNVWLESRGYEITPFGSKEDRVPNVACFALGGRYQKEFKDNLLRHARDYRLGHVKFDFMAHTCDVAAHGHPTGFDSFHAIDAGLADVMDSLRALNPNIALEPLCTGYPPSPWWTTKTPYVLGPYGDDVPYGRVPSLDWMESLISARDIAYRADKERWIMPSQALETIDIVVQNPGDFENLAVMAIGRGRWFISTYLKPELMVPKNWDFLAALVRWARANRQFLGNATMIGGKPENREAYGYMFHNGTKDIYCVRNPWMEERSIQLPACASIREPRDLRMIYPRRETVVRMEPGEEGPRLILAPYETVMLETVAAVDGSMPAPVGRPPEIAVTANQIQLSTATSDEEELAPNIQFVWKASLSVPEVTGAELCILVEGSPLVANVAGGVSLSGRAAKVRTLGSAGQFGAAAQPSPENWKWLIVPISAGEQSLVVSLDVPLERASIGAYVRGFSPVGPGTESGEGPAFPLFRPEQRAWSQTLLPLRAYSPGSQSSESEMPIVAPPTADRPADPADAAAPANPPEEPVAPSEPISPTESGIITEPVLPAEPQTS